jgi:hypothetical protein
MADFAFNIAKGRAVEYAARVNANDPTNAVLVVEVINTSATDATLRDLDTFAAIEADANTAEVANSGYARKVLDQAAGITITVDDTNDRVDVDFPDQTWTGVAAGTAWTDVVVGYDSDSTGGTDSGIVPCSQHDFAITPDGSDVTAQLNAAGFYRAS